MLVINSCMLYPYPNLPIATVQGTVSLDANVQQVINAMRSGQIVPYGEFGGPTVFYFETVHNGLGNFIYTMFDRDTTMGLASFTVRYGAASTIRQVLFQQYPRSQLALRHLILPQIPQLASPAPGTVIPD